jgi:hypothetical protein
MKIWRNTVLKHWVLRCSQKGRLNIFKTSALPNKIVWFMESPSIRGNFRDVAKCSSRICGNIMPQIFKHNWKKNNKIEEFKQPDFKNYMRYSNQDRVVNGTWIDGTEQIALNSSYKSQWIFWQRNKQNSIHTSSTVNKWY